MMRRLVAVALGFVLLIVCSAGLVAGLLVPVAAWASVRSSPAPEQAMTDAEAGALLRAAMDEKECGEYAKAISSLKQVVAFDPRLEADFPDEKIHLQAMGELGLAYFYSQDWQSALTAFELAERYVREKDPNGESILPSYIAECQEKLASAGSSGLAPLAVPGDYPVWEGSILVGGQVMTPAAGLAKGLGVEIRREAETDGITLARPGSTPVELTLVPGSCLASGKPRSVSLSAAPRLVDGELLVPLRAVAEYFGASVRWDSLAKTAWVR